MKSAKVQVYNSRGLHCAPLCAGLPTPHPLRPPLCAGLPTPHPPRPKVSRPASPVVRGSPDPAPAPTEGLPAHEPKGDLRSAVSAGSGDPRRTQSGSGDPRNETRKTESKIRRGKIMRGKIMFAVPMILPPMILPVPRSLCNVTEDAVGRPAVGGFGGVGRPAPNAEALAEREPVVRGPAFARSTGTRSTLTDRGGSAMLNFALHPPTVCDWGWTSAAVPPASSPPQDGPRKSKCVPRCLPRCGYRPTRRPAAPARRGSLPETAATHARHWRCSPPS